MVKSVYRDEELGKNFNLRYDALITTRQRVSYALFYTAALYFNFKLRHEAVNYKNLGGLLYLYLIYCVGTLHGCNSSCRILVVASGMDNKLSLPFTEEEYIALARPKYHDLNALDKQPAFYDYEKSFETIWLDLGRQVLERNLGPLPNDRRKKKDDDTLWRDTNS